MSRGRALAEAGELCFGTVDSWIVWNLTDGRSTPRFIECFRTLLYNIFDNTWDPDLCSLFGIPMSLLPEIRPSSGIIGHTAKNVFYGQEIPIAGIAGDQQAALFGQVCLEKGNVKNTYGTGCFLLMNIGKTPILSDKGLLTTVAWNLDGEITYARRLDAVDRIGSPMASGRT